MKRTFLAILLSVIVSSSTFAQNGAAINTSGASADPSAILDISSDNSGLLIPRMTEAQKNLIISPATGLMIFQTDGITGFWYFDGNTWLQSAGTAGVTGPIGPTGAEGQAGAIGLTGAVGPTGFLQSGSAVGNTPYWDGNQWVVNSSNIFNNGGSVGIGTITPSPSAYLDISGNEKGFLIPRMTTAERNAIVNPSEGLQIYNTTVKCFEYFEYGIWQTWHCASCPYPEAAGTISGSSVVCSGDNSVVYSVPVIINATSYIWSYTGNGVVINGNSNAVMLDFASNATSGVLTVKGSRQCGDGQVSQNFNIDVYNSPAAPQSGISLPSNNQIIWNWNSVAHAAGYKVNTIDDYNTALDVAANLSYTQSALNCETDYELYVWAYNTCGVSNHLLLNQTTSLCQFVCGNNLGFTYRGASVNYGTVVSYNGICWLDRNLGAQSVAASFDDVNAYGDYFQWGRSDDGHQDKNSLTTSTISSVEIPGHSFFILSPSGPNDWLSPANHNLWQGANAPTNPCPFDWRLPTSIEFSDELMSWGTKNYSGAFNSPLKLTASGSKTYNADMLNEGTFGYYWTSSPGDPYVQSFRMHSTDAFIFNTTRRAYGMNVRCIMDY